MGNLLAGKKKPGKHVSNSGMIPCESHPDLHMGTCHLCYVPSTTERLQAAVRDTLPAVKRGKSGVSDGLISCSGSLDTQLVSFQSFSDEGIGTSGDSSPVTSVPGSFGTVVTDTSRSSNSSAGNNSTKRWKRGRFHAKWRTGVVSRRPGPSSVEEYKTAWPVSVKESLFLPEFPVKTTPSIHDNYDVQALVSRGNFSDVSKVRSRVTGAEIALKRIPKEATIRTQAVGQVKLEAMIQTTCSHPFLLSATATWQTRRHLFIATAFASAGDLGSMWKQVGEFPEPIVRIWGAEIALALDHLHSYGIIYRDLKLGNILIDNDGHLKVSDFGLAKRVNGGRAMTICGTLVYMAPEVLRGEAYDCSADWWSFGIVLYALLLGRYPVKAERDHILMAEKVSRHIYCGSNGPENLLSPPAHSLVGRLLRKNPAKRLRTLQSLRTSAFFHGLNFPDVYRKVEGLIVLKRFLAIASNLLTTSTEHVDEDQGFSYMD